MLKVLSYNIEWGKKLPQLSEWMMSLKEQPDIICFQEMPQKKISTLNKILDENGYAYKYAPSYTKGGNTYGELTAYKKGELILDFSKVVELGSSIVAKLISRHNSRYTSLLTVFKYKKKNFIIINLHLLPHGLNSRRRKQLGMAIEALAFVRYVNMPSIIVGDYNYSSLTGQGGLIKFMGTHGFKMGGEKINTHRKWRISHQLDYVFYRNCSISNLDTDKVRFSDHYPFSFKLEL